MNRVSCGVVASAEQGEFQSSSVAEDPPHSPHLPVDLPVAETWPEAVPLAGDLGGLPRQVLPRAAMNFLAHLASFVLATKLVAKYGRNEDVVCRKYALAEERREVERRSNDHRLSADEYALRWTPKVGQNLAVA